MARQLCYKRMRKGKAQESRCCHWGWRKAFMELWGARNQQPYQPQLHCLPPFQSGLGNLRKTGTSSNLHQRSKSVRDAQLSIFLMLSGLKGQQRQDKVVLSTLLPYIRKEVGLKQKCDMHDSQLEWMWSTSSWRIWQRKMDLILLVKNFTNHSVWKTIVRKLKKTGASSREIMAITGQLKLLQFKHEKQRESLCVALITHH